MKSEQMGIKTEGIKDEEKKGKEQEEIISNA